MIKVWTPKYYVNYIKIKMNRFATLSHDEWKNWEFGAFPITSSKFSTFAPLVKDNHRNIDHTWKHFSDAQVEIGIDALKQFCIDDRYDKLVSVLQKRTKNVRVVFENPSNPNNLWAALRTFDSFGLQFVDVVVDANTFHTKRQNTMTQAMGTQKWLTLTQHDSIESCLSHLKQEGYRIVAADLHASSVSIHDLDWGANPTDPSPQETKVKIAIVMGTEEVGISDQCRALADQLFHIPMNGFAESFNLSAATAVMCAYAEAKGALRTPLEPAEQRRLLLTWLTRTVKASYPLLRQAGLSVTGPEPLYEVICGLSTKT